MRYGPPITVSWSIWAALSAQEGERQFRGRDIPEINQLKRPLVERLFGMIVMPTKSKAAAESRTTVYAGSA
jgi:hypothetical protein